MVKKVSLEIGRNSVGGCAPAAGWPTPTRKTVLSRPSSDWVIEIVSESDPGLDYHEKLPRYRQAGIEEIWLVNFFENEMLVETKTATGYASARLSSGRIESTVIPGFHIHVSWLWQEELPPTLRCLREMLG